jgi:hypothetical protein
MGPTTYWWWLSDEARRGDARGARVGTAKPVRKRSLAESYYALATTITLQKRHAKNALSVISKSQGIRSHVAHVQYSSRSIRALGVKISRNIEPTIYIQSTTQTHRATKMSTFSMFPRLPTELRLRIWALTVEPRTVDVSISDSYLSWMYQHPLPVTNTPVPAPLQTCRESRRELQKYYQRGFVELRNRDDLELRYVWVNFKIDIVYIGNGNHLDVYKAVAPQVQRLQFKAEFSDEVFSRSSMKYLQYFTSVKEIFVVCMDGMNAWWGALRGDQEHSWPCSEENVWLLNPENGIMIRGSENDAICEQHYRDQWLEMGQDYDTGLPLILVRTCRRAMRRRAAALSIS